MFSTIVPEICPRVGVIRPVMLFTPPDARPVTSFDDDRGGGVSRLAVSIAVGTSSEAAENAPYDGARGEAAMVVVMVVELHKLEQRLRPGVRRQFICGKDGWCIDNRLQQVAV